jgi:hypothetical protein
MADRWVSVNKTSKLITGGPWSWEQGTAWIPPVGTGPANAGVTNGSLMTEADVIAAGIGVLDAYMVV